MRCNIRESSTALIFPCMPTARTSLQPFSPGRIDLVVQITRDTVKRGFKDGARPETRTRRGISGPTHIQLAGPV
ncbi:hypothetical protein NSPZN2_50279 [Nitrospira defluvii]|uniref:Uncharacterized protein n=1 Tax=Nitrospira defluvii TaxID=330214 RepID=A0ABM8S568_9BACT|nr:hypothetical protein NSPZN2_50279 [Nitrospira defluvii]